MSNHEARASSIIGKYKEDSKVSPKPHKFFTNNISRIEPSGMVGLIPEVSHFSKSEEPYNAKRVKKTSVTIHNHHLSF